MELEKEVRFAIDDTAWNELLSETSEYQPKKEMLDITMGKYGRESLAKTGNVFRVRQKGDKIILGVKKRQDNGDWFEEEITLESVAQGVNFLHLAGLEPYLYLHRFREVRKYNNLKIFFDDFELLGKYIEIEYQDSPDGDNELNNFLSKFGITSSPQDLYGTIVFNRCAVDPEFDKKFTDKLSELISDI